MTNKYIKSILIFQPETLLVFLKQNLLICFFFIFLLFPTESSSQLFSSEDSFIEKSGDGVVLLLPVSAAATTLIIDDYKGTWQLAKSLALNLAVTGAAKVLINKDRPLQGGGHAFPSGHTSVAFQSASFFHRRYGFKYSIPAYVLAGYAGFSRIHATRHDGWDVLAGAVVGIGSTWFFTTPMEKEKMVLTFSSSNEHYLLSFKYTF